MGTRADFYIGRGPQAEWLGSIAWDGYPKGITSGEWSGGHLFDAASEEEFRVRLETFFQGRDDVTRPGHGWPWPWNDSHLTDYSYAFDDGRVWRTACGPKPRQTCAVCDHDKAVWITATEDVQGRTDDDEALTGPVTEFPDMRDRKNVTLGKRSGVTVFGL